MGLQASKMDLDDNKARWGQTVIADESLPTTAISLLPEKEKGWGDNLLITLPSNARLAQQLCASLNALCKDIGTLGSCKGLAQDSDVASASVENPGPFAMPVKCNAVDSTLQQLGVKVKRPKNFRWTKPNGEAGRWEDLCETMDTEEWQNGSLSLEVAVKFMLYNFDGKKGITCHIASGMDTKKMGWDQTSLRVHEKSTQVTTDTGAVDVAATIGNGFVAQKYSPAFCTAEDAQQIYDWANNKSDGTYTMQNVTTKSAMEMFNIAENGAVDKLSKSGALSLQRSKYVLKPGVSPSSCGGVNDKIKSLSAFVQINWPEGSIVDKQGVFVAPLGRCTIIRSQYERTKTMRTENGATTTTYPWGILKFLDTEARHNPERDPPSEKDSTLHKNLKGEFYELYCTAVQKLFDDRVKLGKPRDGDEDNGWVEALQAMKSKKFKTHYREWCSLEDKDVRDKSQEEGDADNDDDDAVTSGTLPLICKEDQVMTRLPVEDDTVFFEIKNGECTLVKETPEKLWGDEGKATFQAVVVLQPRIQVKVMSQKTKKGMLAAFNEPRLTMKARCVIFSAESDFEFDTDNLPHKPSAPSFSGF